MVAVFRRRFAMWTGFATHSHVVVWTRAERTIDFGAVAILAWAGFKNDAIRGDGRIDVHGCSPREELMRDRVQNGSVWDSMRALYERVKQSLQMWLVTVMTQSPR